MDPVKAWILEKRLLQVMRASQGEMLICLNDKNKSLNNCALFTLPCIIESVRGVYGALF